MYAIIVSGGKQYKVEKDSVIKVELLDKEIGETVKFDVLMIAGDGAVKVAADVKDAYAEAVVVKNGKGPKIDIFKYKSKKNERKRQGHRQPFTEVKITNIVG
ncbi:MAG: 50S ribosomal protein L21 [Clostridia bacterium]|jgi:large subunit ribosomal protein L21|nr:50S ribosomal protein L21 [Clostridia bacterium]